MGSFNITSPLGNLIDPVLWHGVGSEGVILKCQSMSTVEVGEYPAR